MKPKIRSAKTLDICEVLRYFIEKGRITRGDKEAFWKEFMNYPSNDSYMGFCPLEYKEYVNGDQHYYSEGSVRVFNLLFDEYGEEEYQFEISW